MSLVPWVATLSLGLLVAGLVLFALKAKNASAAANDLLAYLSSDDASGACTGGGAEGLHKEAERRLRLRRKLFVPAAAPLPAHCSARPARLPCPH